MAIEKRPHGEFLVLMKLLFFSILLVFCSCENSLEDYKKMDDKTRGEKIYTENCSACHGPDGMGIKSDGNSNLKISTLSDDELKNVIRNGRNGNQMPKHEGNVFDDEECMNSLIDYIKSFRN